MGLVIEPGIPGDVVTSGSAQLLRATYPGLDDGGCGWEADRTAVLSAPVRGAFRSDCQHDEVGDCLDRGQAFHRAQRRRLARHATRVSGYLSGNVNTRGGSTIEQQYVKNYRLLVTAQTDAERRAAVELTPARKLREMRMALTLRQDAHQGRDPHPLPQFGVLRQRRIRCAGCGADLLRHRCVTAELAPGRAVGGTGEVTTYSTRTPIPRPRWNGEAWCWTP